MDKKKLEQLVSEGFSTRQIAQKLGCSQTNVRYWLKKGDIDVSKKKITKKCSFCYAVLKDNRNKYCNRECAFAGIAANKLRSWKTGEHDGCNGKTKALAPFIRRYMLEKANYKCEECGWSGVNPYSNKTTLQVDHVDGNCTNNNEENLKVLCPNCHSLTPTYGRLNSLGRRKRGIRS